MVSNWFSSLNSSNQLEGGELDTALNAKFKKYQKHSNQGKWYFNVMFLKIKINVANSQLKIAKF